MRFQTTIELGGKTATGFEVASEVLEALQSGKRPRVRVAIGEHVYRSTVAVYGDRFMLPLSAENREAAGVAAGDVVAVWVELDTEPREVTVPAGLAEALAAQPGARERFDDLSYSKRREFVRAIETAKAAETRQRRIEKAVAAVHPA